MYRLFAFVIVIVGVVWAMFFWERIVGQKPISSFEYDLQENDTLFSYPVKRLAGVNEHAPWQTETPYYCAWSEQLRADINTSKSGPPLGIDLICSFGTSPWKVPKDAMEMLEKRRFRHEAIVIGKWERFENTYRLTHFNIEIQQPETKTNFKSRNSGEEFAAIDVKMANMAFPTTGNDNLEFEISANIRQRLNSGQEASGPSIAIELKGVAEPMPEWISWR